MHLWELKLFCKSNAHGLVGMKNQLNVYKKQIGVFLRKSHVYYNQIVMQLHVTHRLWCDLVVWTTKGIFLSDFTETVTYQNYGKKCYQFWRDFWNLNWRRNQWTPVTIGLWNIVLHFSSQTLEIVHAINSEKITCIICFIILHIK